MNGVLSHDPLLWIMPLVQDRSLHLLISSLSRYHCATDAPSLNGIMWMKPKTKYKLKHVHNIRIVVFFLISSFKRFQKAWWQHMTSEHKWQNFIFPPECAHWPTFHHHIRSILHQGRAWYTTKFISLAQVAQHSLTSAGSWPETPSISILRSLCTPHVQHKVSRVMMCLTSNTVREQLPPIIPILHNNHRTGDNGEKTWGLSRLQGKQSEYINILGVI